MGLKARIKGAFSKPREPLGKPTTITIHHTARGFGNKAIISLQHRLRGYSGAGYHFIIGNGRFFLSKDGKVYPTRPLDKKGAHTLGKNTGNIGIAFIGNFSKGIPTKKQMEAAVQLVAELATKHNITPEKIVGHREFQTSKTECPGTNFDMQEFREMVRRRISRR